jgi:hypothetical protein
MRLEGQLKKNNDLIGIRTRYLPACSIVPQPTMLPRAPNVKYNYLYNLINSQLIKKCNCFYGTRSFMTTLTNTRHWTISKIQLTSSQQI